MPVSNLCVMCGSVIPERQRVCSMCYGDPEYGSDGYYHAYLEGQDRQAEEQRTAQEQDQTGGDE